MCDGNISSSLMSNYCKTDQLRLGLTISKHICSMSALWSCGQDILIFTKYNLNDSSENTQQETVLSQVTGGQFSYQVNDRGEGELKGLDCFIDLS